MQTPVNTALSACLLSHSDGAEVQDGLKIQAFRPFGGGFHGTCRPIQAQCLDEVAADPERAADNRREPGEAQPPLGQIAEIAQDEMGEKTDPDLPPHGVLAVADEVVDLTGLLQFLEERLDAPAVPVDLRNRPCGPPGVVRQEQHFLHLSLDLDDGRDAAERPLVFRGGRLLGGHDGLVPKNLRLPFGSRGCRGAQLLDDGHLHVPLLARHEPDAASVEAVHEREVRVGAVRDGDVASLQVRGQLRGPCGIVVRGVLDDGEGRKPVSEVECQVQLRGGLRASVPSPVEAVHRELDGGRVDGEHRRLDAEAVAPVGTLADLRRDAREVVERLPVQVLRHVGRPVRIGVRECVPHRRSHAHRAPKGVARPCDVADRVERLGLRHLAAGHCRDVALRREGAAQDPVGLRGLGDELRRYGIDYLTDNWIYCLRCSWVGCFHTRVGCPKPSRKATLNRIPRIMNGTLVRRNIRDTKEALKKRKPKEKTYD